MAPTTPKGMDVQRDMMVKKCTNSANFHGGELSRFSSLLAQQGATASSTSDWLAIGTFQSFSPVAGLIPWWRHGQSRYPGLMVRKGRNNDKSAHIPSLRV
ncbi:hypothetical protein KCU59_g89, partial [Aureobasidium melanogenum]